MTAFDPGALRQLVDDDGAGPFLQGLVRTYRRMLPDRVARLRSAVHADDCDTAMDAVLSLRVSSTMTGTVELADLASAVESSLRRGDLRTARLQALELNEAALRADEAIDRYLQEQERAAQTPQASTDSMR